MEGVPGLPGAPQDDAALTRKFEMSHVGGATCRTTPISWSALEMNLGFVIAFLPRSKHLLISWLQSTSVVILEPRKIKSATISTVSPSISHEVMGPDAMILVF